VRLAFLTSGRLVPSSRFRVLQFIPHLQRLGHECLVLPSRPDKYASVPLLGFRLSALVKRWYRRGDLNLLKHWSADVVVLERELFSDSSCDVEQSLRRIARRLVLDVDDGLFVLNPRKFDVLCGMSDHLIAGNELLAARMRPINSRVTVIPTCVDVPNYRPGGTGRTNSNAVAGSRPRILGWTGTAANIDYLEILREPLKQLSREFPIELRVIAELDRELKRLRLDRDGIPTRFVRWSPQTEIADLGAFDIGLMPMLDTEWTRYKCGLKILQYMAAAIPAVASPVGVNATIIQHEVNGWLAASADEWHDILRKLLTDPASGARASLAAHRTVDEQYSVHAQIPRLVACLETVGGGQ
jgi:glycosyltransferase involved in cell wall biosynthesis